MLAEGELTHPFVKAIAAELHSTVRHNTYTITPVASHESFQALFPPHFRQCRWYTELVF